jgi:Tol biopolymer transport system component
MTYYKLHIEKVVKDKRFLEDKIRLEVVAQNERQAFDTAKHIFEDGDKFVFTTSEAAGYTDNQGYEQSVTVTKLAGKVTKNDKGNLHAVVTYDGKNLPKGKPHFFDI